MASPAPAKDFDRVPFPAGSERAGIVGEGLFLALTAKPEESSPTARGLFVREQFLCQHVPDPPPGVNTNLPPVTEAKPQTNRDRMTEHATNASCATCHKLMDGVGFGLEKFDAVGARREQLRAGIPQRLRGGRRSPQGYQDGERYLWIPAPMWPAFPIRSFLRPQQLGAVLAKSTQCQECIVKQYFRFQAGRMDTPADRPLIRKVTDKFRDSGFRFKELMVSLTLVTRISRRCYSPNKSKPGKLEHVANNHEPR